MSNKIKYQNKIGLVPKTVAVNQWQDNDANEVKSKHNLNDDRITELEGNQTVGYLAYSTFALLPATGTLNYSYKVTNDGTLNGYYHWDGSVYVKDASLVLNEISGTNQSDGVSGFAVDGYTKENASLLFEYSEESLFPNADLIVRRYTSDTAITDYSSGTYQTAITGGLQIQTPIGGSTKVKYWFNTSLRTNSGKLTSSHTIDSIQSTSGIGLGHMNTSGDYIGYYLSNTGNLYSVDKYTEVLLQSGIVTLAVNDFVEFIITGVDLTIYVNSVLVHAESLSLPLDGTLQILKSGYNLETIKYQIEDNAIKEYIEEDFLLQDFDKTNTINSFSGVAINNGIIDESLNLFYKSEENLFPNADLAVRRYISDTGITDYAEGYSQTAVAGGLQIQLPVAGSTSIKFYLDTKIATSDAKIISEHTINVLSSGTVGIGYIADNGDYIGIGLSNSGNYITFNKFTQVIEKSGLDTFQAGDVVKFEVSGINIVIYINDIIIHSATISNEFENNIHIAKSGFIDETVSVSIVADSVRDYVDNKLFESGALPNCFYELDIDGSTTGDEKFIIYVNIYKNFYGGFEVSHEVDLSELVYKDYWRLTYCKLYYYNGQGMIYLDKDLITTGESECVYKRNAQKDDFTGGYHGDELVTDIKFFDNGVEIDSALLVSDIELKSCDNFYYLEHSTTHDTAESGVPIPGHPIDAYHVKRTEFDNKGYKTFNQLNWQIAGLVTLWYHGISVIGKDASKFVYINGDFVDQEMTGSSNNYFNEIEPREYYGNNQDEGLSSFVTSRVIKPLEQDLLCELFVADRSDDSKYYREVPSLTVATGDIWESSITVAFDMV